MYVKCSDYRISVPCKVFVGQWEYNAFSHVKSTTEIPEAVLRQFLLVTVLAVWVKHRELEYNGNLVERVVSVRSKELTTCSLVKRNN